MRPTLALPSLACAATVLLGAGGASALSVVTSGDPANPAAPQMGDQLVFHSALRNAEDAVVEPGIAWLSLVQVDPGQEQPMDLEDWSARKAVVVPALPPGGRIDLDWPLRLIQSGDYRVMVSVLARGSDVPVVSPALPLHVREKAAVESSRVAPIAAGVPAVVAALLVWRLRRLRKRASR